MCAISASAPSAAADSGCSTSSTPAEAQAARFSTRLAGDQASLASTIRRAAGAARRTAAIRAASPSPPSLTLRRGRAAAARAAAAMASAVPRLKVKAVTRLRSARKPGNPGDRSAGTLRLEVPEGAVDGIPCGAGRESVLQRLALHARGDRGADCARSPRRHRQRFRRSGHRAPPRPVQPTCLRGR